MLSRHSVGTYQRNELTRNSSGNTRPQLSQLPRPLWTDSSLKSGTGVCELISTLKKKQKKQQAGNDSSNFSQDSSPGKSHPQMNP